MNTRKLVKIASIALASIALAALCSCGPAAPANESANTANTQAAEQTTNTQDDNKADSQDASKKESQKKISKKKASHLATDHYMDHYGPNMSKYLELKGCGTDDTGYKFKLERNDPAPAKVIAKYHVSFDGNVTFTDVEKQEQKQAAKNPAPAKNGISHDEAVEIAKNYWLSHNPDKPTDNLFAEEIDHCQIGHKVWIYYSYPTHYAHLAQYTVMDDGTVVE